MPEPVKRLFHPETEVYTNEGNDLETEIHNLLQPVLDRCTKANYAMRDVEYIISAYIGPACSFKILSRAANRWKQTQATK